MAIPLSLSSLSQSTSFLSSFDVVLFCVVIILTLLLGIIHTFLVTKKLSSLTEENTKENEYDQIQTKSRRASDISNHSTRNTNIDSNGDETEGNQRKETNGDIEGKHRNGKVGDEQAASNRRFRYGLAIMPGTDGVSEISYGAGVDIMFQLICFASVILTMGLPMYTYFHGPSITISIFPSMLAAHVTSIFIVIPFVKRYRRKKSQKQSFKQLKGTINDENFSGIFPVTYLHERFGGFDNASSNQSANRTEILHHVSSSNVSYKIFSILTWTLILILWGFVTSVTLYSASSIVERIISRSSVQSKLYTVVVSALYTAVEGKRSFLWTDVVLSCTVYFGLVLVVIFGMIDVPGGISQLINKGQDSFVREAIHISPQSYGSMMIGQYIIWLFIFSVYYCSDKPKTCKRSNQDSTKESTIFSNRTYGALLFNVTFLLFLLFVLLFVGLILDVTYISSNPCSQNHKSRKSDNLLGLGNKETSDDGTQSGYENNMVWSPQVFSHFVIERLGSHYGFYGFPGLFLAAICAHSLSVISTGFNAISDTLWQQIFIKNSLERRTKETRPFQKQLFTRSIASVGTFASGCLIFAFNGFELKYHNEDGTFPFHEAFQIIPTFVSLTSSIIGVLLAIFLAGLFFPFANARGTTAGALVALIFVHFLSVGYLLNGPNQDPLPLASKLKLDRNNQVTCFLNDPNVGTTYVRDHATAGTSPSFQNPQRTFDNDDGEVVNKKDNDIPNKAGAPQLPRSPVSIGSSIGKFIGLHGNSQYPRGNIVLKQSKLRREKRSLTKTFINRDIYSIDSFKSNGEDVSNLADDKIKLLALSSGSRKSQPPMITYQNSADGSKNDQHSKNSQNNLHFSLTSGGGGGASGMHGNSRVVPINRNAGKKGDQKVKVTIQDTSIFYEVSYNVYGILSFVLTLVLSLLFSVLLRVDKNKNNGQSIEQFTITQSAAGSDDQIIQQDKNELDLATQIEIKLQQDKNRLRNVYDGLNYYDSSLLHPVVKQFCCCPIGNDYSVEEDLINAEMRILSRRPSHVPIVTSSEEVHLDPETAPIAHVIKQRRASIYTVTSDQYQNDLQRRMSRLSRQSSGRSDYGGPTLTVPVINNVLDAEVSAVTTAEVVENSRNLNVLQTPTFQQRVTASPNLARAKTITHNRLSERRKSHIANVDLNEIDPQIPNRDLGRRNSLSPNIVSQINLAQMNVQRGGSFRKSDRRLSQQPGYSIGGKNNLLPEPLVTVPDNSMIQEINTNVTNQLLAVPGQSFDRDDSTAGSPRRINPPNLINTLVPPNENSLITPEELATQRRFSVVNEAMERHNTRRKNKRSQSVMYRPGQARRVTKTLSEKN